MTRWWIYDHEYFQRMIDRNNRDNPDMNIALGIDKGIFEDGIDSVFVDGTIG